MDATDRISELPEPILHHIFSLLHFKYVARMSTMSKTLNNACNSLSYLNFGYDDFYYQEIVDVARQTLASREKQKISIQKFLLELSYGNWRSDAYELIDTLAVCNIKELQLAVPFNDKGNVRGYDKLLEAIFVNAKSLNVLKLEGFYFKFPYNGIPIKLSSLREFHLRDSYVDEQFIQSLCTACCNLEAMGLYNIFGLTHLLLVGAESLSKLKKVSIFAPLQWLDIRATNLEDLDICFRHNIGEIKVVKISVCKALKTLYLNGVAMTDDQLEEIFPGLENIEKFELNYCETLKTMKISSVKLKQLKVYASRNIVAVELDTPNLIRFSYDCDSLPTLELKDSGSLEAYISFEDAGTTDSEYWNYKLMTFLDNFRNSKAIELTCKNDKALVIPKDMRENLLPPLYGTNRVQVNLRCELINYSVVDFLDSVFWISPQLDILCYCQHGLKILKFIYDDALDKDEKKACCTSQPWKCWRHKLKKVKMECFSQPLEKIEEVRDYFVTNTDIISEMFEVLPANHGGRV